jgi:copper chaperone CopZ
MSAAAPGNARDFSTFIRDEGNGVASLELAVEGMRCAGCMASVERAVGKLDGVVSARVNLTSQRLNVTWREGTATPDQVIAAVDGLGFRAYPFVSRQAETREEKQRRRRWEAHCGQRAGKGGDMSDPPLWCVFKKRPEPCGVDHDQRGIDAFVFQARRTRERESHP